MCSTNPNHPPYQNLHIYYLNGRVAGRVFENIGYFIGNWEEEGDSFLFFTKPADDCVGDLLHRQPHLSLVDTYQMTYEQWHGGPIEPIRVGRLNVVPPWMAAEAECGDHCILLDPGVVFGTGAHPTTYDCLEAMQLAFGNGPVGRVLDLGTGTGLLALAAVRLGARNCLAVDLNRLAVQTALINVRHNGMAERILVVQGDAKNFMDQSCDLMVSNIHYDIMRELIDMPGFRQQKQFILSGLLRSQAREIAHQLRRRPVKICRQWERDGIWHTFWGLNEDGPVAK